ncbi:MAG: metal-sensitive transcriptional regulator [Propionibacteriaceae bacterium]|jgi:DNA-binding FrmR family transcriptional regulator|uniref:metal-sensitive transcriptional regulator n=1 Tax=Propionicimonas sp. T2.31MG-18 TaxID=3157620 RepID=UPI001D73B0D8|nr:metal-sensitive transcriptional regulator [Actinomycetota bacterium]MCB0913349.1 metal-sensitive transcriptional regulator [Propionibacteriaceae bacterium]
MPGDQRPDRRALLTRLHRIEGQVRGIGRMIDDDVYCIDVLTQVSAASSALRSVALVLLEQHLQHCLAEAAQSGNETLDAKVTEASEAIARLVRS